MMKRVLCLYMPWLKVERLEPGKSGPGPEPLAVVEVQNGATMVVQANRAAGGLGVRRGMTLAESRALVPNLRTVDHDPDADRRALEKLADWASCLSPIVHIEDETTLLLDVTGCERLFQGEPSLVRRAVEGLREQGFTARAALADTAGAAWALAHAHYEQTIIVEPGRVSAAIAPLPVWSLRVDARVVAVLRGVGVETVEALLHLPRASVAARFGDGLLRRLDEALGAVAEVLVPFRPVPAVTCSLRFGRATTRLDVLLEAFQRLLEEFCTELAQRGAGVRRVCVTLYGQAGGPHTVDVQTSAATRSPRRLRSLGRVRLESLRLPSAVQGMSVWTREVGPLAEWQDEFFDTGRRDTEGLAELVDRLSVRLGPDGVRRVELVSDHQPEKGYRWGKRRNPGAPGQKRKKKGRRDEGTEGRRDWEKQKWGEEGIGVRPVVGGGGADGGLDRPPARPVRLLRRPAAVAAVAVVPDGPPVWFEWQGQRHDVAQAVGPERIETGWWRGQHVQRDYYRVAGTTGGGFWLFRDRVSGQWFVHGVFD